MDDCSRFCVIAHHRGAGHRAGGVSGLRGRPDEVLTDIQTGWRVDDLCSGRPPGEDHDVRHPPVVVVDRVERTCDFWPVDHVGGRDHCRWEGVPC